MFRKILMFYKRWRLFGWITNLYRLEEEPTKRFELLQLRHRLLKDPTSVSHVEREFKNLI